MNESRVAEVKPILRSVVVMLNDWLNDDRLIPAKKEKLTDVFGKKSYISSIIDLIELSIQVEQLENKTALNNSDAIEIDAKDMALIEDFVRRQKKLA